MPWTPWNPTAVQLVRALVCGLVAFWGTVAVAQERFVPKPDTVVLAASVHALGSEYGALREAEQQWRKDPKALEPSLRYARAAFLTGLTEGDLRWYGSAKAALQPWWAAADLSPEGLFLRGLIKQGFHDFSGGLADVNRAIAADPSHSEYWSWRFSLHLLASEMEAARLDCNEIESRFGADEGRACLATWLYRNGQPRRAVELLDRLVRLPDFQGGLSQDWLRFHQGEAYRVLGQPERAIDIWGQHLKTRPRAHGVRVALAELLNERGLYAQARRVALTAMPTDALLVQSLLASRGLGEPEAVQLAAQVESRMQSQGLRRETLIERPQMMYLIRYGRDVAAGLALAADNWAAQNEPTDAALLVEAALKENQPKLAEPVLAWMSRTGYSDPVLEPLARQLKARLGRS